MAGLTFFRKTKKKKKKDTRQSSHLSSKKDEETKTWPPNPGTLVPRGRGHFVSLQGGATLVMAVAVLLFQGLVPVKPTNARYLMVALALTLPNTVPEAFLHRISFNHNKKPRFTGKEREATRKTGLPHER